MKRNIFVFKNVFISKARNTYFEFNSQPELTVSLLSVCLSLFHFSILNVFYWYEKN